MPLTDVAKSALYKLYGAGHVRKFDGGKENPRYRGL